MEKGKQKKRAIGKPKSRSIQKGQTTQTKKTLNPSRKSARKSKRFSNMASEIKRAAKSAIPSASGTTTKIKTAGGTEAETTDVWSVRMLVAAVGWSTISTTKGLVAFFLENLENVMVTFQLALNKYGNVMSIIFGSLIIDLDCGSQENFSKFQKDLKDGKVQEALENELRKIGCDAKLEVFLMKETPNVARTEMSKETVNFNPEVVSHGEGEAEKERDQEADNSDVEDGSPPKRRRPSSSSGSDLKRNKATAGNLNMREPPELRETLKLLKMKDLPPKTTRWKDIEEKFLPVDFLLSTAKKCEHLSCLSFLDDIKMGYNKMLGPVYFGFNSSKSKIAVIKCVTDAAGFGGPIVVLHKAVPILRPKAVICVGYCASLDEKKAKLGDVIVPAKLITYNLAKVRENKIEHRCYVLPPSTKMAKCIKVAGAGWVAPLKNPEDLKVIVRNDDVLLSGPSVLDNSELRRELKNRFLQGTAIETEGEDVYAAAINHGIECLVIKGVSDFGDGNKSSTDSWRSFASVMAASLVAHMLNDSIAFENWRHYEDPERNRASADNSDVEDGSPPKRRRPSSSSGSDPKRNKATAGESYAEAAQPGPSNQGEPRSIRPVDKAPTTYKGVSDFGDDNKSATDSWRLSAIVMAASFVAQMLNDSIAFENWCHYGASFKAGVPSEGELEHLSLELGDQWEQLGGRLGFNQAAITCFDRNHKGLNRKAFKMLIAWRKKEGADATYKVLYDALCDKRVQCKLLAQQFCCE